MSSTRPSARAHRHALLRSILSATVDEEFLSANPCRIRGAGRAPSRTGIRPAPLEELQRIATAMPERYRLMVQLAAWCALRFGELTELRPKDIDLTQQVIRVRRGVTWPGGRAYVSTPKSAAGIRDVSIPPHLISLICEHLELHSQPGADGLIFPNTEGRHMHHGSLYRVYRPARAAAGRPDLRWHDLRHTAPRWLPWLEPPHASSWTDSATQHPQWRCGTSTWPTIAPPKSHAGFRC
jgi:integrase